MTLKRIGVGLLALVIYCVCLELGERFEVPGVHSFVSTAEAIVGRPLTPMSYQPEGPRVRIRLPPAASLLSGPET